MTTQSTTLRTSKSYFTTLILLHASLLLGQFVLGALAYYVACTGSIGGSTTELSQMLLIIVPLIAIGGIIGGSFLAKAQIVEIKQKETLLEKLMAYQTTLLIKYALLEGASLLAIISYLLTGNTLFMGIATVIILLFVIYRPTITKIIVDLELDQAEIEVMKNPHAFIEK